MLSKLVQAADRFHEEGALLPTGYKHFSKQNPIRWVLRLSPDAQMIGEPEKVELEKPRPFRQRSGKPSMDNLKPYLLVDEARYALGKPDPGREGEADLLHAGFRDLLREHAEASADPDIKVILRYLQSHPHDPAWKDIAPKDVVTFTVDRGTPALYPFERPSANASWKEHIQREFLSDSEGQCSSCNKHVRLLQTLPLEIVVLGQKCQITSHNKDAFTHFGKEQTLNAPLCFICGARAAEALNHLLGSDTNRAALTRENLKRGARNPLRNQVAVFWLARPAQMQTAEVVVDIEAALAACMDDPSPESAPHLSQMEHLLRSPETGRQAALQIADNAFYLAVLSPNKARLVIREWFDASLADLLRNLTMWFDSQRIVGPEAQPASVFALRRLLRSLYRDEDETDANPNLVRGLLRTAFQGNPPPSGLLEVANDRFAKLIPSKPDDRPADRTRKSRQLHALAALIKLVLTYMKGDTMMQQSLNPHQRQPSYLCGRLLAILAEAQRRASASPLNRTVLDRFYGSVSAAPGAFLPMLIKRAVTDHLPKIRRDGRGHARINNLMQELATQIDNSGGFPQILSLSDQGAFALGFYHQRAELAFRPAHGKNSHPTSVKEAPSDSH